jgi:hypothetical protein
MRKPTKWISLDIDNFRMLPTEEITIWIYPENKLNEPAKQVTLQMTSDGIFEMYIDKKSVKFSVKDLSEYRLSNRQ